MSSSFHSHNLFDFDFSKRFHFYAAIVTEINISPGASSCAASRDQAAPPNRRCPDPHRPSRTAFGHLAAGSDDSSSKTRSAPDTVDRVASLRWRMAGGCCLTTPPRLTPAPLVRARQRSSRPPRSGSSFANDRDCRQPVLRW